MIRVIKTRLYDAQLLRDYPEFLGNHGPGLLVTLGVAQSPSVLIKPGTPVRVHRPDGSAIDRIVGGIEVMGKNVGLFFPNTGQHEIPVSSGIELPG
jgi:hypothetical protein